MAVYDSGLTSDLDSIRTALDDELPVSVSRVQDASNVISASTTPVLIESRTINGVLDDEAILILARCAYDSTVITDSARFDIYINGVSVIDDRTLAASNSITLPYVAFNLSGNVVIGFYVHRHAGTGTVTAYRGSIETLRFKKRA